MALPRTTALVTIAGSPPRPGGHWETVSASTVPTGSSVAEAAGTVTATVKHSPFNRGLIYFG